MKTFLIRFFILTLFLFTCSKEKKGVIIKQELLDIIKSTVRDYEEATTLDDLKFNPDVYEVRFQRENEQCYLLIISNNYYNTEFDATISIDDNLVVFYNLNSDCNRMVAVNKKADIVDLSKFDNETNALNDYHPKIWKFKIENRKFIFIE
tara:strand:+ start:159 stop:608 length:450 start_codon:yes stop_codon:yes gene_type:complete